MKFLLIAVHGLNAHWPGPYGNEWVNTPQLDALAAASFVFDHHFCTRPTPAGFRESWRTGGRQDSDALRDLAAKNVHALLLNRAPDSPTGEWATVIPNQDGKSLWALARQAAKALADKPDWFACVETAQLLRPWTVDEKRFGKHTVLSELESTDSPLTPWPDPVIGEHKLTDREWERLRLSFACVMEELDRDITLIRKSFFPNEAEDAVIVITGTHGFPLAEHGHVGPHPAMIFADEVHVPLIVHSAASRHGPRRCAEFTTADDLHDGIRQAFGLGAGPSLLNPVGFTGRPHILAERPTPAGSAHYFRNREWSYSLPVGLPFGDGQLFSQPDDYWEAMNLAHTQPGPVEDIANLFKELEQ